MLTGSMKHGMTLCKAGKYGCMKRGGDSYVCRGEEIAMYVEGGRSDVML
jgi:hypothetical protein